MGRTGMPDLSTLLALLEPWRGARAKIVPLVDRRGRALGNHGDMVMMHVFATILGDAEIAVHEDGSRSSPDLLLVPPSGALLEGYQAPALVADFLAKSPELPVVVFPSSAYFPSTDPAAIFRDRAQPTTFILREPVSLRHLEDQWGGGLRDAGVTLALDHDVAITGNRHVRALFDTASTKPAGGSLLVASRLDPEARTFSSTPAAGSALRRLVVASYERLPSSRARVRIRRRVTRARQAAANDWVMHRLPTGARAELAGMRPSRWSRDISDASLCTFPQYLSAIADSAVVVTNRLHVAVPAAALGRRVFLVDSGYHKLRGVYEHSLRAVDDVTFVGQD